MFEVVKFLKTELRKLFLYIVVLIIVNILVFSLIVFKLNDTKKIPDIIDSISNELTVENNVYSISQNATNIMNEKNIWAILIDKNNGNVIWDYHKPKEVASTFSINDVAIFSKFYLNDYPVFSITRHDGLLVFAFPKNSFVRYNMNYFSFSLIQRMPIIALFYILGNIFVLFILLFFTHYKLTKEMKPINDAILSIPNDVQYTTKYNNAFEQIYTSINKINKLLNNSEKERKIWIESISHDIRTPLSNIVGFASNLSSASTLDDDIKHKVIQIEKHGKYITELINNLNLNTKLNTEYKFNFKEINFITFIKNTIINIINENENSLYNINFTVDQNIKNNIYAKIDIILFERLIRNIVYNSIKHNPNGCELNIELIQTDNKIHISFTDNGIGVNNVDDIINNINNKKNEITSLNKLGLFIVSRIIELHNGTMKITSKKNNFFTIELIINTSNN